MTSQDRRDGPSQQANKGVLGSFWLLSVALEDQVGENPDEILKSLKFDPVPGVNDQHQARAS